MAAVGVAFLLVPALAHAHTFTSFDYPWGDRVRVLFMLLLATVSIFSVVAVLIRGSFTQRIIAAIALALPIYVVVRFIIWAVGFLSGG